MKQTPLPLLYFIRKVAFLTLIFSILGMLLFPHTPNYPAKTDHAPDEEIELGDIDRFRQDPGVDIQQVDEDILRSIGELLETDTHSAAIDQQRAQTLFTNVCSVYSDICNKISWEGIYDLQEKLTYQLLIIYLIKQIDERLMGPRSLRETLSYIKIYRDEEERRGSAGHTHVKMNVEKISTPREFREVLTHEFGHVIDLGVVEGTSGKKDPIYTEFGNIERSIDDPSLSFYEISRENENVRKDSASYKDFVSGYGMKGVYEDFAESENLWFNHNALFLQLAQSNTILAKKYSFIDRLYDSKYFKSDEQNVPVIADDKRPWDTTKLH